MAKRAAPRRGRPTAAPWAFPNSILILLLILFLILLVILILIRFSLHRRSAREPPSNFFLRFPFAHRPAFR
jgi:flagellar biogenesis protein FliO